MKKKGHLIEAVTQVAAETSAAGSPEVAVINWGDLRPESEDGAFEALGLESFAEDWNSDEDSIYDHYLEDADLR